MQMNQSREWLMKKAEQEDGCTVSIGTLKQIAVCPECKQVVELRESYCDCSACKTVRYFTDHLHNGEKCFGSGHRARNVKIMEIAPCK